MDEELKSFLRKRNIEEECIQQLEKEKIDTSVIPLMADKDLAKYFPKAGDRVSVVAFCRQTDTSVDPKLRKESILARLRRRLSPRDEDTGTPSSKKRNLWTGNKSAQKQQRRIEVGWMDFDAKDQRYKQVKSINGGGTRQLTVDKGTTVEEIRERAESLFFPNGVSKKKKLASFITEIQSSQIEVNSSDTVIQLYEKSGVRLLRLYLCTKVRRDTPTEDPEDQHSQPTVDLTGSEDEQQIGDGCEEDLDLEVIFGAGENDGVSLDDTIPCETPVEPPTVPELQIILSQTSEGPVPVIQGHEINQPQMPMATVPVILELEVFQSQMPVDPVPIMPELEVNQPGDHVPAMSEVTMIQEPQLQDASNTTVMNLVHVSAIPDVIRIQEPLVQAALDTTVLHPVHVLGTPELTMTELLHTPEQLVPDYPEPAAETLIIRRGHCLLDLINAFKNPAILHSKVSIKMRLPNGKLEEGEGSGVLRDCLTEFWTEFYERCTLGMDVKVPLIRHDYQCDEWQAIGRIFVVGWFQARYFPVQLAAPFLEVVLYGTSASSLKDAFLQYVSAQEREILLNALKDFESVENDALLDALEAHECHQVPTKENLVPLLSQMGHKALIQAPMYIIECWRPIVEELANDVPPDALDGILKKKIPTGKAVKDLLFFPEEMNASQSLVARYLKRYISELDLHTLQLFLRFCTGSNLIDGPITVEFIETSDFQRRPQSHTCAKILKLPIGYQNYPDLRSDFNSILSSSVWVMDIV
ncbi:uncharacterized protein LOC103025983 isoform X1 [Astyanax mexicanus]|uniref:uncharacterized protein LOC125794540 isoform X1 n=1 Tax=Astyanax mexicanus TaxID=7994 RepID=UPI000BBDE05D|nr:uncharacterized protein LOC125794540 isoform X1 [Astyanax mexicanus]XP_049333205.1 uncharacterized protein LOC125801121 isoform X1 [Astyanax mexicanus]XP_049341096.1 uncharacterized protein LOC103025983 isoform X1 [Astyanax mexicanus]